jgi:two-component system LytT family response regulator
MKLRVLIVDDEPLAREGVRMHLEKEQDIEIIGECANAKSAIEAIANLQPDLIFLDIKMPKQTGFDVVKTIGVDKMPMVIFLTAYDKYAIEAFQINATDYLLKPINPELFSKSVERARSEFKKEAITRRTKQLSALLDGLSEQTTDSKQANRNEKIVVRSHGHVHFLRPEDILWVEAEGDYISLHTTEKNHLIRETMRNMEKRLVDHGFQRIHRSIIVKLDAIVKLSSLDTGDYQVLVSNGDKLKLSRSYRDTLFEKLNTGD